MEYKIEPKRVNEKLTLELDSDEVEDLRCIVKKAKTNGTNWINRVLDFLESLEKSVQAFQN